MTVAERDLGNLLSIDVEAEVRKLTSKQLGSRAEQIVEIVRLLMGAGASAIRIATKAKRVVITSPDGQLSVSLLETLAYIADGRHDSSSRHLALLQCEALHQIAMLSVLAAPGALIRTEGAEGGAALSLGHGQHPKLQLGQPRRSGITVSFVGSGNRRTERAHLENACRWSNVPIFLDRRRLDRGGKLRGCFLEILVEHGNLHCRVGLPRSGELSHTVALVRQILGKERFATSPNGEVHLAIVTDVAAMAVSQLDLEEMGSIVRRAREQLYAHLRVVYSQLGSADRLRASDLLMRQALHRGDQGGLIGMPLFAKLDGGCVALEVLRNDVRGGSVWAVEPDTPARRWLVPPGSIYVLDARQRQFLRESVDVVCQQPPAVTQISWMSRTWLTLTGVGTSLGRRAKRLLGRLLQSQPLPVFALTPAQRCLVAAVQAELESGKFSIAGVAPDLCRRIRVEMTERGGLPLRPNRLGGHLVVMIPRRQRPVKAMVAALTRDSVAIGPIMTSLFGGYDGYGKHKAALHRMVLES